MDAEEAGESAVNLLKPLTGSGPGSGKEDEQLKLETNEFGMMEVSKVRIYFPLNLYL